MKLKCTLELNIRLQPVDLKKTAVSSMKNNRISRTVLVKLVNFKYYLKILMQRRKITFQETKKYAYHHLQNQTDIK